MNKHIDNISGTEPAAKIGPGLNKVDDWKTDLEALVAAGKDFQVFHEWTGLYSTGWAEELHPYCKVEGGHLFEPCRQPDGGRGWVERATPAGLTPRKFVEVFIDPDNYFQGQLHVELL